MENTPQPKKTNWGMIILLVILIPVLLLGYKFISKKMDGDTNNVVNTAQQNNGFALVGDWYYQDTGAQLKYVNDKYSFTTPQMVNGILKGQMTATIDWMQSVQTHDYEVMRDGKLRIIDVANNTPPYEMDYVYNAASQTLEISDQGYKLTYTRTPNANAAASNNNNTSNNNTTYTPQQSAAVNAPAAKAVLGNVKPSPAPVTSTTTANQNTRPTVANVATVWFNSYNETDPNGSIWSMNTTRTFYDLVIDQNGNLSGKYLREYKASNSGIPGHYAPTTDTYLDYYTFILSPNGDQFDWTRFYSLDDKGKYDVSQVGKTGISKIILNTDGTLLLHDSNTAPIPAQHTYKRIK